MDTLLKKQLRREASAHGMCQENRDALASIETIEDAVSLYKKTIDWALEEGYPNFMTLQKYFSNCENLGIFVGREFHGDILSDQQIYIFHNCTGTIRVGLNVEKRIIPMLYFANGCDMTVKPTPVNGDVRVPLYVFGDNIVKAKESGGAVYKLYKFDTK